MAQKQPFTFESPFASALSGDDRSDEALLAQIVERDQSALAALYDRYSTRVFALAIRLLGDRLAAEEVTQDVFLRLWQHADSFQPGGASFLAWLLAITRNRSIDELRSRRAVARRHEAPALLNAVAADADPQSRAEDRLLAEDVRQALSGLPPAQRQAVELAIFAGLSHSEIAAALGAPLGTVKSWLRQGLQRLRLTLGQGWPDASAE
jgi:RNA polymerase sigma-70 factor (ECF subfamily)